jgi:hypothetical protein
MERIRGWALIIKLKNRETGGFGEDWVILGADALLFFRNKIVPQAGKSARKMMDWSISPV